MKKLFLFFLVLISLTSFSQTVTGDRIVGKSAIYLRDWWIDSIQRDTSFTNKIRSLPTSEAVRNFVEGRISSIVFNGNAPFVDSLFRSNDTIYWRKSGNVYTLGTYLTKSAADIIYASVVHGHTISDITGLQAALDGKESSSNKGVPGGYPNLGLDGKVPVSQLSFGAVIYKGTWNAKTNTPTLQDGVGTVGWMYVVSDSGTINLGSGNVTYYTNDQILYNGSIWQRSANTNLVTAVAGKQGDVNLTADDVAETAGKKYITPAQILALNGKVNISDTASMLNPYLHKADTANKWQPKGSYASQAALQDTAAAIRSSIGTSGVDTTSLSNRINTKLNKSDTSAMLLPYLHRADTASLSSRINGKLNIGDTTNKWQPKGSYAPLVHTHAISDVTNLQPSLNAKANQQALQDTAAAIRSSIGTNSGGIDTTSLSNRINAKQDKLNFTPENITNKAIDFSVINDTRYPTVKAVNDKLNSLPGVTGNANFNTTNVYFDDGGTANANTTYRQGNTIYLTDSYTGEVATYNVATTKPGGGLITNADIDGFIIRKKGSEYFIRNVTDGRYNAGWWNVKQDSSLTSNSVAINKAVSTISKLGGGRLVFDGDIYLVNNTHIDLQNNVILDGGGVSTMFMNSATFAASMIMGDGVNNVGVVGFRFVATPDQQSVLLGPGNVGHRNGPTSNITAITIRRCTNVYVDNIWATGLEGVFHSDSGNYGDAGRNYNLTLNNITTYHVQEPAYIQSTWHVRGLNWNFEQWDSANGDPLNHGIYLQRDLKDVVVTNVVMSSGGGSLLNLAGRSTIFNNVAIKDAYAVLTADYSETDQNITVNGLIVDSCSYQIVQSYYPANVTINNFEFHRYAGNNGTGGPSLVGVLSDPTIIGGKLTMNNGKVFGDNQMLNVPFFSGYGDFTAEFNNVDFYNYSVNTMFTNNGTTYKMRGLIVKNCHFYWKTAATIPWVFDMRNTARSLIKDNYFIVDTPLVTSRYVSLNSTVGSHTFDHNTILGYLGVRHPSIDTRSKEINTVNLNDSSQYVVADFTAKIKNALPDATNQNNIQLMSRNTVTGKLEGVPQAMLQSYVGSSTGATGNYINNGTSVQTGANATIDGTYKTVGGGVEVWSGESAGTQRYRILPDTVNKMFNMQSTYGSGTPYGFRWMQGNNPYFTMFNSGRMFIGANPVDNIEALEVNGSLRVDGAVKMPGLVRNNAIGSMKMMIVDTADAKKQVYYYDIPTTGTNGATYTFGKGLKIDGSNNVTNIFATGQNGGDTIIGSPTSGEDIWLSPNPSLNGKIHFGTKTTNNYFDELNSNLVLGNFKWDGSTLSVSNSTLGSFTIDYLGTHTTPGAGGWSRGNYFNGSSGTKYGGFGANGSNDNGNYLWMSGDWNAPWGIHANAAKTEVLNKLVLDSVYFSASGRVKQLGWDSLLHEVVTMPAGSSGGVTTFDALTDVNISGKVNGSIPKWNSTTSKWEMGVDNTGSGAADGNKYITGLAYSGTDIKTVTATYNDASTANLGSFTDLQGATVSAPVNELIYGTGTGYTSSPNITWNGNTRILNVKGQLYTDTLNVRHMLTTTGIYSSQESHLYTGSYFDPGPGILASVKISANAGSSVPTTSFSAGVNGTAVAGMNTYGGYFNNISTVSGSGINYGLYVIGANNYFSGKLNVVGSVQLSNLAGASKRMVVADDTGALSTQPIPTGSTTVAGGTGINVGINGTTYTVSNNAYDIYKKITTTTLQNGSPSMQFIDPPNGAGEIEILAQGRGDNNQVAIFHKSIAYNKVNGIANVEDISDMATPAGQLVTDGAQIFEATSGSEVGFQIVGTTTATIFWNVIIKVGWSPALN